MSCYLSFVMGVGGAMGNGLLDRLKESTRLLQMFGREAGVHGEIVIVEWNVPLRHYGDIEVNVTTGPMMTRVIHTPKVLHDEYTNPHGLAYFEMAPKNIGIRRAQGKFVLCTNPDDLYGQALMEYFAEELLEEGHFYRVNRHDMREGKVFQICHATGAYPANASEQEIKESRQYAAPWNPNMLHFNAAGDFTLMSKADWFTIHGNPEREYNNTVDGQTIWLAHQMGFQQIVLPYPLYHIDHPRTLNTVEGRFISPGWDDNNPFTKMNGESWGYPDAEFLETVL